MGVGCGFAKRYAVTCSESGSRLPLVSAGFGANVIASALARALAGAGVGAVSFGAGAVLCWLTFQRGP